MQVSVSTSSGEMWTNCDEVQQAVQLPQGTSEVPSFLMTSWIIPNQVESRPASRGVASFTWTSHCHAIRESRAALTRIV
jgi:hypothetical protein